MRNKLLYRLRTIFANATGQLLAPLTHILFSLLVIRWYSVELWGSFISLLIIPAIIVQIAAWGNKDYLLRAFAATPAKLGILWQDVVVIRLVIVAGLCTGYYLYFDHGYMNKVLFWIVGGFLLDTYKPVVQYKKAYRFNIVLQSLSMGCLIGLLWYYKESLDLTTLLTISIVVLVLKLLGYLVYFFKDVFATIVTRISFASIIKGLPFLFLGLSGFLASKTDIYLIDYFLNDEQLGTYQLFISFITYFFSFINFSIEPYLKNLYRSKDKVLVNYTRYLRLSAFIAPLFIVGGIYVAMLVLYDIRLDYKLLVAGYIYSIPNFIYIRYIYRLFKEKKATWVAITAVVGALVNLIVGWLLIPHYGILGALIGSSAMQWTMLVIYLLITKQSTDYNEA